MTNDPIEKAGEKAGELIAKYQDKIDSKSAKMLKNGEFTEDEMIYSILLDLVSLVHLLEEKQEKAPDAPQKKQSNMFSISLEAEGQ